MVDANETTDEAAADLLQELGVGATTLARAEADALDEHGFVVQRDVFDAVALEGLRAALERRFAECAPDVRAATGTRHTKDLACADPAFARVFCEPRVLAAVHHVLKRPFRLFQLSGRDPLPGYGQQGLHQDWTPRGPGQAYSVVTALFPLDDFTAENGATRVVPGSHVVPRPLPKSMRAPGDGHPDQELACAPAGDALVFNGHLWHSGTQNRSRAPRRALQCQYVARHAARPVEAPDDVPAHLGSAARRLLGIEAW